MGAGLPLGFFASGYFSGMGAFLTEPTRPACGARARAFCYNFGRGIGALFPALVGYLSERVGLASPSPLFALSPTASSFLAAFALPETKGRVLHADT